MRGLDFLFVLAFLFGVYALYRLLPVQEEGSVEKGVALQSFHAEVRKALQNVSNVAGLRILSSFSFGRLATTNRPILVESMNLDMSMESRHNAHNSEPE